MPGQRVAVRLLTIRPYLDGQQFDDETVRAMGVAFEMTRAALEHGPSADLSPEIVAAEIIELAPGGATVIRIGSVKGHC